MDKRPTEEAEVAKQTSEANATFAAATSAGTRQEWRHERLPRALALEPLFRRRVQVLLAAGVLAFSAVGTATSVATEPDQGSEGLTVPGQDGTAPAPELPSSPADPAEEPTLPFEQPGSPTDRSAETTPAPPVDAEPLEAEPADDPYGRLVLSDPESAPPLADDTPAPAPEPVAPEAPVAPDATPQVPPTTPPAQGVPLLTQPELIPSEPPLRAEGVTKKRQREPKQKREQKRHPTLPSNPPDGHADVSAESQTSAAPPTTTAAPVAVVDVPAASEPPPGIPRFHVVKRGESLWAIATDLLGPEATNADIAREVARLWSLNEERIGTGDPNLLIAGVKLRLR